MLAACTYRNGAVEESHSQCMLLVIWLLVILAPYASTPSRNPFSEPPLNQSLFGTSTKNQFTRPSPYLYMYKTSSFRGDLASCFVVVGKRGFLAHPLTADFWPILTPGIRPVLLGSRRRGQVQARNGARRRELKPNRTSLREPDSP